jgi:hypothetical protein
MSDSVSEVCTIHNVAFGGGFTMISNKIFENPNLSWQAKGLLSYILSRPPNWHVHSWQLSKIYEGEKKGNGICSIKTIIKELKDNEYISYTKTRDKKGRWIHRYDVYPMPYKEFKKIFPEIVVPPLEIPEPVNRPIINNTDLANTELPINICAEKIVAKKSKKIQVPVSDKIERRKLVFTSVEEHDNLLKKFGDSLLNEAYDYLNEWKQSKKESEPKAVDKHTDFFRIKKWVVKDLQKDKVIKSFDESREWEKTNRELFFNLKKKHFDQLKGFEYSNGYILNKSNNKDVCMKMLPSAFQNIMNDLVGISRKVESSEKKLRFKPNGEEYYE